VSAEACPWCVRVTCVRRWGGITHGWTCMWSGVRAKSKADAPCAWCRSRRAWDVRPVFHRLGHVCQHKPKEDT
jgi:hypothetical protein